MDTSTIVPTILYLYVAAYVPISNSYLKFLMLAKSGKKLSENLVKGVISCLGLLPTQRLYSISEFVMLTQQHIDFVRAQGEF